MLVIELRELRDVSAAKPPELNAMDVKALVSSLFRGDKVITSTPPPLHRPHCLLIF